MPRIHGVKPDQAPRASGGPHEEKQPAWQLTGLFAGYLSAAHGLQDADDLLGDQVFSQGLERVQLYLQDSGQDDGGGACLICLGHINPTEAVWHCQSSCFAVMHLTCIQEWSRSQLDAVAAAAAAAEAAGTQAPVPEWGCPKCRHSYAPTQLPCEYRCFCGKQLNPDWDPWVAAHSCGEACGKPLRSGCGHECLLLCHPGPCPPCPLAVDAPCYCGKTRARRRCGHDRWACGSVCGRLLDCGHACPHPCHEGPCEPCLKVGKFRCRCGLVETSLPCGQRDFQCQRPCGRDLDCGRHKCEVVCHAGTCAPCPSSGARVCPCGKQQYPALTCADKAPVCGGTCGKLLPCGVHHCEERCHTGACPSTCKAVVLKNCRCGRMQREVPCHTPLVCERRCNGMRPCQRHACKRRCCDGRCPPCEEVCGRWLRCGNHKCPAPCHAGPCRPCPLTLEVACACGAARSTLPCGAEKWAAPPRCNQPCKVPQTCRHCTEAAGASASAGPLPGPGEHKAPSHTCHYGPCPPCDMPCNSLLACGHVCGTERCHDPPPPAVGLFQQPAAPAALATLAYQLATQAHAGADARSHRPSASGGRTGAVARGAVVASAASQAVQQAQDLLASGQTRGPCPPCRVQKQVHCLGRHTSQQMDCSAAAPFSCGAPCGHPLACGNHTCTKPCHLVANAASSGAGEACERCSQLCFRPRTCSHPCGLQQCHPGACPLCSQTVSQPCHCGKVSVPLECHQLQALQVSAIPNADGAVRSSAAVQGPDLSCGRPCHRPLPNCSHPCREPCHPGPCPGLTACREEVTVRCSCKRLKVKWPCHQVQAALAAAGKTGWYDASVAPRLLPCGEACDAKVAQQPSQQVVTTELKERRPTVDEPLVSKSQLEQSQAGRQRLSKAEREAQAQSELLRRDAERRLQKWRQTATTLAVWVMVALVGLLLAVWGKPLLAWLDSRAQARWRPS